jgi:hypothetical protein
MATVEIHGWREGFLKISCTNLLRDRLGLGLREAKACTDRILDGEFVTLSIADRQVAVRLAEELRALGADATVTEHEADV